MAKSVVINVRLETKTVTKLDTMSKRLKIPRATLLKNIVEEGVSDVELLDKTGVVSLVGLFRRESKEGEDCSALSVTS